MPNGGGRGWVPLMHLFIPNVIKSYHVGQFGIKFTTLLTIMVIKKKVFPLHGLWQLVLDTERIWLSARFACLQAGKLYLQLVTSQRYDSKSCFVVVVVVVGLERHFG